MPNKTKILFRIRSMEMGGVQKVLIDILKNLDRNRFQIALLLNLNQGPLVNEIPGDIPVIALADGKDNFSQNKIVRALQLLKRRTTLRKYEQNPSLLKNKIPFIPDIEVCLFHYNFAEMLRSPFKNSKKIGWYHAGITELKGLVNTDKIINELKQCDVTVHVSANTLKDVIHHSDGKLTNGIVIHNAFDWKKIRHRSEEEKIKYNLPGKTIVSVGRLAPQKGYDILIDAHKELLEEGFHHNMVIIGGGEDEAALRKKIHAYGLEKSFLLYGQKQNPFPYIAAADCYIQPSRYEAYPLSVGEAMILGKTVVATNVGGVSEMMKNNTTGIIVEPTKNGLKEGILQVLQKPELVKEIETNLQKIDFEEKNQEIYSQIEALFLN